MVYKGHRSLLNLHLPKTDLFKNVDRDRETDSPFHLSFHNQWSSTSYIQKKGISLKYPESYYVSFSKPSREQKKKTIRNTGTGENANLPLNVSQEHFEFKEKEIDLSADKVSFSS